MPKNYNQQVKTWWSPPSGQVVGSLSVYVAPTRKTRGGKAKAKYASRLEVDAKLELDAREDELAQEAQESGPEGSRILGERGAEVQEWGMRSLSDHWGTQ